jgi:hypothetical protein
MLSHHVSKRWNAMLNVIVGAFIVLHGLVHLLYFGQSWRLFELQPGMTWPDGAWAFKFLGDQTTRFLASIACIVSTIGFVAGGVGILISQVWWRPMVVGTAIFSSVVYILFWDGKLQKLDGQGAIAILINIVILFAVFVLQLPNAR